MANQEHVKIVKQGAEAIANWRKRFPGVKLDLSYADLSRAYLCTANLRFSDLSHADLSQADLRHADFRQSILNMANLHDANLVRADLSNVRLTKADLSGAGLVGAFLVDADIRNAILTSAQLKDAKLSYSNLEGADLTNADLTNADFCGASLSGADLSEARLGGTRLESVKVDMTNFANARCGTFPYSSTLFLDLDLSSAKGLEQVEHDGPSLIDVETLYLSKGQIPEVFLRGCGVPKDLINYLGTLSIESPVYYSCFISFTEADDTFGKKLYNDLRDKGVGRWRWKEDAKWGRKMWGEIDQAILDFDKVLVILSAASLKSNPVIREIERALQKEDRGHKDVLFPILLDNAVFSWKHELQPNVKSRVIGDFSNWEEPNAYKQSFDRLIECLQAESKTATE